jgi:hypothetical protein
MTLLTAEEVKALRTKHEEFKHDEHEASWCFPDIERMCDTLNAALKVVDEAEKLQDCPFCGLGGKIQHDPTGCVLAPFRREGE